MSLESRSTYQAPSIMYVSERTVQIIGKNEVVNKPVTKGCPQRSVLGPSFWNLIFDDLLTELATSVIECEPIA